MRSIEAVGIVIGNGLAEKSLYRIGIFRRRSFFAIKGLLQSKENLLKFKFALGCVYGYISQSGNLAMGIENGALLIGKRFSNNSIAP